MYKVEFSKKADKAFARFNQKDKERIQKAVQEKLAVDPIYHTEPLRGKFEGAHKFRVGKYRLTCNIKDKERVVVVEKIFLRGHDYRRI